MSSCYIVTDIVQDIEGVPETGYAPFNFAPASEGGSVLLFHFTDESFTRVLSALRNGAYMTYGDEGRQVIWDFLKNVEYPVDFCDQVAQALLTCEDVQAALATVITTEGVVQDAIVDMLQANEEFTDYVGSQVIKMTSEQINGKFMGGDCDNSVVAGRVVAIVERINTNNEDFLEIVEVGTNDEERVSAVISAIPGLSEAPVDEILDILQSLLENFTENYAAAVTEGWKDSVEEALYCIAKTESEDCSLTYQQLFEYFRDRAGADLTLGSLIKNVIEYVINGDFSNDELVASGMYAIQLGFILTGQDFNGLDLPTIGAITRDALPSTKWEDWDDCSSTWCRSISGSDLQSMFTPAGGLGPQASWTGTGYGANNALIPARITLEGDLGATHALTSVRVIFSGTNAVGDVNTVTAYTEDFVSVLDDAPFTDSVLLLFTASLRIFEIDVVSSFAPTTVPITVQIDEIRVTGTGTEPSFGTAC